MFTVTKTHHFTVTNGLIQIFGIILVIVILYFFSTYILRGIAKLSKRSVEKLGVYSVTKDYEIQRYVYQHDKSLIAKLYYWINEQLIALGIKRQGVTVFGYLTFWGVVAAIAGIVLTILMQLNLIFLPMAFLIMYVVMLVMTRVAVSERMEQREADIMNAVDLIVPEVKNGVKNAIVSYMDNFAPSVKGDFAEFISNVQDRGFTFEDAMFILSDHLGLVFKDFAQKAIYFEQIGDPNMYDIFTDIAETNRLRRQIRDENNNAFATLRITFVVSTLMVVGYFIFLMVTDNFSRNFFLGTTPGKLLLLFMLGIVFFVLAYITTIKSSTI